MKKTIILAISLLVVSCEMKVIKIEKQDAEMEKTQLVEKFSFLWKISSTRNIF